MTDQELTNAQAEAAAFQRGVDEGRTCQAKLELAGRDRYKREMEAERDALKERAEKAKRLLHNGREYDTTPSETEEVDRLWNTPINQWPPDLTTAAKQLSQEVGVCGEVPLHAISEYVKGKRQ